MYNNTPLECQGVICYDNHVNLESYYITSVSYFIQFLVLWFQNLVTFSCCSFHSHMALNTIYMTLPHITFYITEGFRTLHIYCCERLLTDVIYLASVNCMNSLDLPAYIHTYVRTLIAPPPNVSISLLSSKYYKTY